MQGKGLKKCNYITEKLLEYMDRRKYRGQPLDARYAEEVP